jgi:hypothetical protein
MSYYYLNDIKLSDTYCPYKQNIHVTSLTCDKCIHHIRHKYLKRVFKVWCRLAPSKTPEPIVNISQVF